MKDIKSYIVSMKNFFIQYRKIVTITAAILIPILAFFIIEAVVTGKNANRANHAIETTLPGAFAYVRLERNVMNMQKWLYYVGATRNEKGYDSGFKEAEAYYQQALKEIDNLKKMFADDPAEIKKIEEIDVAINTYYEVGIEVANAYVDQGTFYGNAMLKVFSSIDTELSNLLREKMRKQTEETMSINVSIKSVLQNTGVTFIFLGFLVIVLGIVSFNFLVKRDQLNESHEKLSKAMEALWGEMELARKIQTILLPEAPSIKGYDITATMIPADEVGGDYYDIINVGNKNWIVIGDVSGHGVSAGLVMMMVQTSIQTVLRQYPKQNPTRLLNTINHVISRNIQRFGEKKYMTITVLACEERGKFVFSGLHQDMMVYRNLKKRVELVETRGMWIGLLEKIDGMCDDDSFNMKKGDVLFLFTDGITEAVDAEGKMFGQDQLANIFKKYCKSSGDVNLIKDKLLGEIRNYRLKDDATIVILKRK
ncbi:MAG: PP2C family protein-serine/threonine phosphatase [Spirochaetes bacterium]|nr:PP2C family protein-serine/threonine phosphatase [Spirochaetota bacterium]